MGLDIYLKRYNNFEDTKDRENKYNEFSESIWKEAGEYESLTDEQKNEIRQREDEFANTLGLNKWGSDETECEKIEIDHPDYPEHYFKIGYFRSSYNSSGIERILGNLNVPTMHDIFEAGDEYEFHPDWDKALTKCEEAIDLFKTKGAYRVNHVSENIFKETSIKSEKDALDVFLAEIGREHQEGMESYSNSFGEFHLGQPLEVVALIPGTYEIFKSHKCVYVVTKSDNEWYMQALEIIRDTIKYVLTKENKNQYYLSWSG